MLNYRDGTVICRKLGEFLFSKSLQDSTNIVDIINTKNISERELGGLQYLSGYVVVHKLFQKERNSKHYKSSASQEAMAILQTSR